MAEIEFWQSVKTSQDPSEFQAYLDLYPQGKFAPLARIRIKKLSPPPPNPPTLPIETTRPPPPIELPVFKPDGTAVTKASCQQKLGRYGFAAADFTGTGSVCLCRAPFGISQDGASCINETRIAPPPPARKKARKTDGRPKAVRIKKKTRPARIKRKSAKRPTKARARAIANRYCRQRYGANLRSVVVKKSKFYCHYTLGDGNYLAVKKKKFKDVPG